MKTKKVFRVSRAEPSSVPDDALTQRIVEVSKDLFLRRGFIRVTTDEISAKLGISKATLYKSFATKEDLLRAVVQLLLNDILTRVEDVIKDERMDFVDKLVSLLTFMGVQVTQIVTVLAQDIQKAAPEIWEEIEMFRREKIFKNFRIILEAGVSSGMFKKDINLDLLLQMFMSLVQNFLNPETLLRLDCSATDIFRSIFQVFFEGILTDEPRREFVDRKPYSQAPAKEG